MTDIIRFNPYQAELDKLPKGSKQEPVVHWLDMLLSGRTESRLTRLVLSANPHGEIDTKFVVAALPKAPGVPHSRLFIARTGLSESSRGPLAPVDLQIHAGLPTAGQFAEIGGACIGGACRAWEVNDAERFLSARTSEGYGEPLPLSTKDNTGRHVRAALGARIRELAEGDGSADPVQNLDAFELFTQMTEVHAVDPLVVQTVTAAHLAQHKAS